MAEASRDPSDPRVRRAEVERHLAGGDVSGLRVLAAQLEADGIAVTADELRADLRSLGAVRVRHGDSSVLALPVDGPSGPSGPSGRSAGAGGSAGRLRAEVSADPDWPIQVGVAAVAVAFLVIGLLGWLISS